MKKKIVILVALLLFGTAEVNATSSNEYSIDKELSFSEDGDDMYNTVVSVPDGYIVVGESNSSAFGAVSQNDFDIVMVKHDNDDNIIWRKSFGGSEQDRIKDAIEVDDGFIITGYTTSADLPGVSKVGGYAGFIGKYDYDGNEVWIKGFDGNADDMITSVVSTPDGYIASGYTNSTDISGIPNKGKIDGVVIKYDKMGNVVWMKSFGGNLNDYLQAVTVVNDGYVAIGYSESTDLVGFPHIGKQDGMIIKYDTSGNMVWTKKIAGSGNDYHLDVASSGSDIVVVGYGNSNDLAGFNLTGLYSTYILKYDLDGNMIWMNTFGGDGTDRLSSIMYVDNSYIATGYTSSTDIPGITNIGNNDSLIIKFDTSGNILWSDTYGGSGSDRFESAFIKNDSIIAVGWTRSNDISGLPLKGNTDGILVKYKNDTQLTGTIAYDKTDTYEPITVTLTASKMIKDIPGWTRVDDVTLTKVYDKNVKETITVHDMFGNTIDLEINITNILEKKIDNNIDDNKNDNDGKDDNNIDDNKTDDNKTDDKNTGKDVDNNQKPESKPNVAPSDIKQTTSGSPSTGDTTNVRLLILLGGFSLFYIVKKTVNVGNNNQT